MAIAKKCDRCGKLYEPPKNDQIPYGAWLKKEKQLLDLCPDCEYDLETGVEHPEKKTKKVKRTMNISDESRQRKSERQHKVATRAGEIMEKEGCTWQEAMSKSNQEYKNHPERFTQPPMKGTMDDVPKKSGKQYKEQDPEEVKAREQPERTYRCTMCGKGKFSEPHQLCPDCKKDFPG